MNNKEINYTEASRNISITITKGEIVADFLPSSKELMRKEYDFTNAKTNPYVEILKKQTSIQTEDEMSD